MHQVCRQLWRHSTFKHLLVSPRLCPGVGHRSLISISCSFSSSESVNCSSCDFGSLPRSSTLSWSIREAHSGTAGKNHGRRKKSIKPTSLQYTKRGGDLEVRTEEDIPEDYVEKDSKGQSKRKALRALKWGNQLAALSPSQLRQAIRWASLDGEVYDAVMLVKSLGPNVRNGKRRQFNFIGLMARMNTASVLSGNTINEDETNDEETDYFSEEEKIATQWLRGLLDGDEAVNNEVFSSTSDVYFDRQELKKLMRMARGTQNVNSTDRTVETTKSHNALLDFFIRSCSKTAK